MADNRVHERFATEVAATILIGDTTIETRTKNLSSSGVCFDVNNAIELGQSMQLRLALIFDQSKLSEPLDVSACVVWCTPIAGGQFQIGTSFTEMTNESRSYLGMFLRFLSEGQDREAELKAAASDEGRFS